jgi:hypothetical protein
MFQIYSVVRGQACGFLYSSLSISDCHSVMIMADTVSIRLSSVLQQRGWPLKGILLHIPLRPQELQVLLPVVSCCDDTAVAVEVASCEGSSVRTLMTLLTESGEDTPLESLSMSSVSGLKSSSDKRRGRGRARGSGRPRTIADDRRTNGKGLLAAPLPEICSNQLKCHCSWNIKLEMLHSSFWVCTLCQPSWKLSKILTYFMSIM